MIEKLYIPTLGRVNNQKSYNGLPEKWKRKTYLVVQDQEYNEYDFCRPRPASILLDRISEIIPTSESTAIIKLYKSSGKYAMAFCYWINMSGGQWRYFFPTYDHCAGMELIKDELRDIEKANFPLNFKEENEIYG